MRGSLRDSLARRQAVAQPIQPGIHGGAACSPQEDLLEMDRPDEGSREADPFQQEFPFGRREDPLPGVAFRDGSDPLVVGLDVPGQQAGLGSGGAPPPRRRSQPGPSPHRRRLSHRLTALRPSTRSSARATSSDSPPPWPPSDCALGGEPASTPSAEPEPAGSSGAPEGGTTVPQSRHSTSPSRRTRCALPHRGHWSRSPAKSGATWHSGHTSTWQSRRTPRRHGLCPRPGSVCRAPQR